MTTSISAAASNAVADAIVGLIDQGSANPSGALVLVASGGAEVARLALSNPAFGPAISGLVTSNLISDDMSATGGTIAQYILEDRDGNEVVRGDVDSANAELVISSVVVDPGGIVEVSSLSIQIGAAYSPEDLAVNVLSDNTIEISAVGELEVTITSPAEFAGTYMIHTNDLFEGPINLVVPDFTGTVADGNTLTAAQGLWVHDTNVADPTTAWQWLVGGVEVPGETGTSYVVQSGDPAAGVSVRQTLTNSWGSRSAESPVRNI